MPDVRTLITTIKSGHLNRLTRLDLTDNGMTPQGMKSFLATLSEGKLSGLKYLSLGHNFCSGDLLGKTQQPMNLSHLPL